MPRARPEVVREILDVDWPFFGELCRALALHVSRAYDPELIVGIAKAGVIPAAIIASILQCELVTMVIGRAKDGADPELITGPPPSLRGRRVLIVDETCDSGDTLRLNVSVRDVDGGEQWRVCRQRSARFCPGRQWTWGSLC